MFEGTDDSVFTVTVRKYKIYPCIQSSYCDDKIFDGACTDQPLFSRQVSIVNIIDHTRFLVGVWSMT